MLRKHSRRHITHFEVAGGTCHVTWRLACGQRPLTPDERGVVRSALLRSQEFGAILRSGVVMDDHVHVFFSPGDSRTSRAFVASWKGATSRIITKSSLRTAPLWQAEYFLRWMNSADAILACTRYIHANPERRWPGVGSYPWLL